MHWKEATHRRRPCRAFVHVALCMVVSFLAGAAHAQSNTEPPPTPMARYRADRCSANASGLVSCEDLSGHGYTAVAPDAGHSPHIVAARIGGQPALVSIREERLQFGSPSVVLGSNFTLVVIGQHYNTGAYHLHLNPPSGTTGSATLRTNAQNVVKFNHNPPTGGTSAVELTSSAWNGTATTGLANGQAFIAVGTGSSVNTSLVVDNGTPVLGAAPSWPLALNGTVADGQFVAAGQTALTVAETIIYDRVLTRAELDRLHAYARRRYGLLYQSSLWQNGANLAKNSTFDTDLTDWYGRDAAAATTSAFTARETVDTNSSVGALRVTLAPPQGATWHSHVAGAVCNLKTGAPLGFALRVQFAAKSVSGANWLTVGRVGGGGATNVQITNEWKDYDTFFYMPYSTGAILFNTVARASENLQAIVGGVFLLDNVRITVVAPSYANMVSNDQFETNAAPWSGQKEVSEGLATTTEFTSRFVGDTPNQSSSSLRIVVPAPPTPSAWHNHLTGATAQLFSVAPAGSVLRVKFWAKRISGANYLSVSRIWGGGDATVQLTNVWQAHELNIPLNYDTQALVFAPVSLATGGTQDVVAGTVLIDNVDIRIVQAPPGALARFRADRCAPNAFGVLWCEDLTGNGNSASAASLLTSPVMQAATTSTRAALLFDATSGLQFGDSSRAVGAGYTVGVVGQYLSSSAGLLHLNPMLEGAQGGLSLRTSATLSALQVNAVPPSGASGALDLVGYACEANTTRALSNGERFVALASASSGSLALDVNGAARTRSGAIPWSVPFEGVVGTPNGTAGAPVGIAEVFVYDHPLTESEKSALHDYTQRHHNVSRSTSCPAAACSAANACNFVHAASEVSCSDAFDNDDDGRIDCQDLPDCAGKPGCEFCGDGVVTGSEACDPGADPRCNATCTSAVALNLDCSHCASGQACPSTPNGSAFGLAANATVCVPTLLCNRPAPACGTPSSPCGTCSCLPRCDNKVCGDSPSDGCGGTCLSLCAANTVEGRLSFHANGNVKRAELGIDGKFGPVVDNVAYTRDGLPARARFGDGSFTGRPATESAILYDVRRRPIELTTVRAPAAGRTPATLGAVSVVAAQRLHWDGSSNLHQVEDRRIPSEWPAGHKPYHQRVNHDALYRVARVDYSYASANQHDSATSWRSELARRTPNDGMRTSAAPAVANDNSSAVPNRVMSLAYSHDWLANMTEWSDDAHMFYERSLGSALVNGSTLSPNSPTPAHRPSALYLAANLDSSTPADLGGWLEADYGKGGNLLAMTVHARCTHAAANSCKDPGGANYANRRSALSSGCRCAQEQYYVYRWDELNRLAEARRYDQSNQAGWWLKARQRYRYDGENQRVLKQNLALGDNIPLGHRSALYVYPGDFERRGLVDGGGRWEISPDGLSETQYLIAGARVVWKNRTTPTTGLDADHRITVNVSNLIGSTSAVLDLVSGELVEAGGFYPNGAREELLGAVDALNGDEIPIEPSGFTGKEAEEEVGLTYFGERYLVPRIARWATPDPLSIHAVGGGEALNAFHYLSGNLLQARDPLGLEGVATSSPQGAGQTTMPTKTKVEKAEGTPNQAAESLGRLHAEMEAYAHYLERKTPAGLALHLFGNEHYTDLVSAGLLIEKGDDRGNVTGWRSGVVEHFAKASPDARLISDFAHGYHSEQGIQKNRAKGSLALDNALFAFDALSGGTLGAASKGGASAGKQLAANVARVAARGAANPKSVKTFQHTFLKHGEGAKVTRSLTDTARSTGKPQGQWLNNQAAADLMAGQKAAGLDGPVSVPIPEGLGQVIMPNGAVVPATRATLVPGPNGFVTGYPIP